jgi:hypothetical protein
MSTSTQQDHQEGDLPLSSCMDIDYQIAMNGGALTWKNVKKKNGNKVQHHQKVLEISTIR